MKNPKELQVAQKACFEAGKIAVKYFHEGFNIMHKGKADLVTDADIDCENKIREIILNAFPEHSFLGEESGRKGASEFVWVVDPIDGTTNFSHRLDVFSHSIGLVKGNEILCGAIFNPLQKKLFTAAKGKGAFLNGKKIHVSKTQKLVDSLLVTGFPYERNSLDDKTLRSIASLRGKCQDLRRFGSAALDFCSVAQGVLDGFFEYSLKPWDVAAGILIVREAGGKVTDINGLPAQIDSGHFLASNGLLHNGIMKSLERVE